MKNALSQRYSSAFIETFGSRGCQEFIKEKEAIKTLFESRDFMDLIGNPFIDYSKKYEFVNEVLGFKDETIKQSLLLLAKSGRLGLLPEIVDEVSISASSADRKYRAVVYCNSKMSNEMLEKISKILCQKLNLNIEVEEQIWDKDGIKCVINELDLEVSFSKELFVSNLQKYILDTFRKGV